MGKNNGYELKIAEFNGQNIRFARADNFAKQTPQFLILNCPIVLSSPKKETQAARAP